LTLPDQLLRTDEEAPVREQRPTPCVTLRYIRVTCKTEANAHCHSGLLVTLQHMYTNTNFPTHMYTNTHFRTHTHTSSTVSEQQLAVAAVATLRTNQTRIPVRVRGSYYSRLPLRACESRQPSPAVRLEGDVKGLDRYSAPD
jgi:hypothetical protein